MWRTITTIAVFAAMWFLSLAVNFAFATGESESWSRTQVKGVKTPFTIEHSVTLRTSGFLRVTQTLRGSAFTGVEVIEEATFHATLVSCASAVDCHKVWIVSAQQRLESLTPSPLVFDGKNSANLLIKLPAEVSVYDFEDGDRDGNLTEEIGSFIVPLQLEVSWQSIGDATSSIKCGWDKDGNRVIERDSSYEAFATGAINTKNPVWDSGEIFENLSLWVFKSNEDPCTLVNSTGIITKEGGKR